MIYDETEPSPSLVLELIEAFRRSQTMFSAVRLGVFDALEESPMTCEQLAQRLGAHPEALGRLLNACVNLDLLEKAREHKYRNMRVTSKYLCLTSPERLTGYITFSHDVMWPMWNNLSSAVAEGTHRWKQTYGWDGPIFDNFFHTEAAKREFLWGMHGYGLISSPAVVDACDLSPFRTIVDLGGATGHLAVSACLYNPHMRGIVFDLPEVIALAQEYVQSTSAASRVQVQGGDFFRDPLPPSDLYAVGRILHDWGREKIDLLLNRIYDHLPPGGGLLIAEKLLCEDKSGPRWALMQNLNMLLCTEGKERSLSEYAAMLQDHGFVDVRGFPTTSPLDAILARKPGTA